MTRISPRDVSATNNLPSGANDIVGCVPLGRMATVLSVKPLGSVENKTRDSNDSIARDDDDDINLPGILSRPRHPTEPRRALTSKIRPMRRLGRIGGASN